ncbi:DUF3883 domain-containing protein [Bradyrhizobium japonicum]|nr:DUF3883 domain-containing protein [Bradyrhizobium japonicum]
MLDRERQGERIVKAEIYRRLGSEIGRSTKSIEWKLRNVSAVLEEIGVPWLPGLLPAHNYQDALVEAVGEQVGLHPQLLMDPAASQPRFTAAGMPMLVDQPTFKNSDERPEALRRLVIRYDPAERDELNRSLGRAGERMVIEFERQRLRRAGRDDLATKVRWVSDLDGDHLGYDVKSFEADGEERLMEVKTTNGHARTRFWLSANQCEVAASNPDTYRVRRIYHFRNGAQMFDVKPPLDASLLIKADKYVVVPR